ncbi:substrate-binding domain-containing protein [Marinobacter fonticola]|uniref:substrate-binding domain-containing protein n=1 Tax=Marinobacter fonticola TaxID=2603215 RepID=UPI0011E755AC|nr:substrate-binding domain-containing protein [Marinobacter fonticola]
MKRFSVLLVALMLGVSVAQAEVVVVGNPAGPDSITLDQVRDIYLNRSKALPNGQRAVPYELAEGNATRETFHEAVTGRSGAQLKAFWSQQVFTGKGQPPQEIGTEAAMKSSVASTPGSIGYIDSAQVDDSVKVILKP